MQIVNRIVLYHTVTEVKEGDEFYEISLSKDTVSGAVPYVFDRFHCLAGHLPPHPEKLQPEFQKKFTTVQEATEYFDESLRLLVEGGFVQYDPHLHGQERPFNSR